ncbi:latent-transforming growth factor beta-binding protein 1-like [Uloborus diversus]|uniref:latent-transforming growth factor beta-binding protein 1-like n=1 Tax=Uloborus diversus TaxID=327109 RepID=UPI00240990A9|nr:latent-transforming growth factor beta-binding protein 1-like [Uloborus diversus]
MFSNSPYTTPDFQTTLDCGCQNGLCVIDIYGNLNCVCNPQYAKNGRGICTPCFCGQDANCEFVRRGGNIQKRCFCPKGYQDSNGYCTDINECLVPRSCPKFTECRNTEGSYDCFCRQGYRPHNRTSNVKHEGCVEVCNLDACVNGQCQIDGYSYFCKCDNGYTGRRCDEKTSDNRILDIIEIQSPWIILSALLLIIFLAFICIHRNKSVKKNTFIFSSADDKCPLFEDPKFVNRLQTEILE